MKVLNEEDYLKIESAIYYIKRNYDRNISLLELANHVGLSQSYFQKLFTKWAGISPKKFQQFISVESAKRILKNEKLPLLEAAHKIGLSGTGRLYDLFMNIEGMTPGEYKNGGKNLTINYSLDTTFFGSVFIASTAKGICFLIFEKNIKKGINLLKKMFPNAQLKNQKDNLQKSALSLFQKECSSLNEIKLHLRGTEFQLKVWQALLSIPLGSLTTYSDIASFIGKPRASRAVGSAVGKNPVGLLIPCHRVIMKNGDFGNYMWGAKRKTVIIEWEGVKNDPY